MRYTRDMEGSRFSLAALAFMTIVAAAALGAMLLFVDPTYVGVKTRSVFYLTVFVAVTGIAAWGFLLIRGRFGRVRRPVAYFFTESLRQGAFIATLLTASLFLQAHGRLTLLVALGLVAAVFLLEAMMARAIRR